MCDYLLYIIFLNTWAYNLRGAPYSSAVYSVAIATNTANKYLLLYIMCVRGGARGRGQRAMVACRRNSILAGYPEMS